MSRPSLIKAQELISSRLARLATKCLYVVGMEYGGQNAMGSSHWTLGNHNPQPKQLAKVLNWLARKYGGADNIFPKLCPVVRVS